MKFNYLLFIVLACLATACASRKHPTSSAKSERNLSCLRDSLSELVGHAPGTIGIALISSEGDTLTVNDQSIYPMMSVFKLHQSLAVVSELRTRGADADTVLIVKRNNLDENTWSPMLKDYPNGDISISARELIAYMLLQSDNNASNILFDSIVSTSATDAMLREMLWDKRFEIKWKESDMHSDNRLSYENVSSPLSSAELMYRVFNDSLVDADDQKFIRAQLESSPLTNDRLGAPFAKDSNVRFAHKSGSGYVTSDGVLIACNDVGYIHLPCGLSYSLAVFIRDYTGSQEEAVALIAEISRLVYEALQ